MNRAKFRSISTNMALLLLFSLGAFLLAEFAVRLLLKDQISLAPRYQTDATCGGFTLRRVRSNSVYWQTSVDGSWRFETNARGLRNREDFAYDKPDGVVRILIL